MIGGRPWLVTSAGLVRVREIDGERMWSLRCPGCGVEGLIDDDQFHGRVSCQCECGWHETRDFAAAVATMRTHL